MAYLFNTIEEARAFLRGRLKEDNGDKVSFSTETEHVGIMSDGYSWWAQEFRLSDVPGHYRMTCFLGPDGSISSRCND